MYILLLIVVGITGFFIGRSSKHSIRPSSPEELKSMKIASYKALNERTEERKRDIVKMMENTVERHEELKACGIEAERKGINRRDVEELLGVSDQTALKYLNQLEEEGAIKQIGNAGKDVYYMLIP